MAETPPIINLLLSDLATTAALPEPGRDIVLEVTDKYLSDDRFSLAGVEGLAIQRLITLAHDAASKKLHGKPQLRNACWRLRRLTRWLP